MDRTTKRGARVGAVQYLDAVASALAEPNRSRPVKGVAGSARRALLDMVAEYEANSWRVVGKPRIVSQTILGRTDNPPTLTVRTCLDNSEVLVVDVEGRTVPGSHPPSPRSMNIFVLVRRDDAWVVAGQTFPQDPDC